MASFDYLRGQAATAKQLKANVLVVQEDEERRRGEILLVNNDDFVMVDDDGEVTLRFSDVANISFSSDPIPYGCNVTAPC